MKTFGDYVGVVVGKYFKRHGDSEDIYKVLSLGADGTFQIKSMHLPGSSNISTVSLSSDPEATRREVQARMSKLTDKLSLH